MQEYFNNKKPDFDKLLHFGFVDKDSFFEKSEEILEGEFCVVIKIFKNGTVETETIETSTKEIYSLHLIDGVKGSFVGQVKKEYEKVVLNIIEKCFYTEVFKSEITKQIIKYITEKYGDNPEYLWEKFPNNAVFRRKDNEKWYAAILTVKRDRLGFDTDEIAEIIDLRAKKEDVQNLIKQENIYPGWHMNKKSWITIILDGSMDTENIIKYIDESYSLAKKS